MSFPEEEQQQGPAVEQEAASAPEPRLLTRPDREAAKPPITPRHKQAPAERGLEAWSKRITAKRRKAEAKNPRVVRVAPQMPRRSARHVRRWGVVAVVAGLLLAVLVLVAMGYLRHAASAALPSLDGSVRASGLQAPVTVARDPQGVPTITANSLQDLLFAQGYTTAGDRLWQMDGLRRHAAGELAEVLGSSMVEHDRRQRILQIRAAADRAVAQLPADQLAQLEAYSRGVNAYLDAHSDALPLEFRLLAYKPARWTPRDSLLVLMAMWQDLSTEFPHKMDREALSAHLPQASLADLYPVGSWRDQPPAAQSRDLTTPHIVEQIPLDPSQSRATPPRTASPQEMLAVNNALTGDARCEGCRSGSNNWAVSGAHTASGAPMVSNDMHLSLAIPDIWYEASLHAELGSDGAGAPRLDVTGFTLPGVPFVIVGRNARVAWGVTNLGADVQDLRIEHLRGAGDSTEYERADGSWTAAAHHAETIRVRGGLNVSLDVMTTTHPNGAGQMETPIVSPLYAGEQRALSLAWTAYDPTALSAPFLGMDTAADGTALTAALAHLGGPALNLVWADAGGHIGYHAVGMVPVRGPAVQHPRAVAAPIVDPGATPPDESTDEPASPEAFVATAPHLVLSAFSPQRRGRSGIARRSGLRGSVPSPPRARGRARRVPAARAPQAPVVEAPLPPPPPVVNYTIGSPISPVPVDALDANQAWSEYIPYEALPSVVDPKNGLLATANARITPDDYPYFVANDWTDPFRVERIVHMLSGRKGLVPADMLAMEMDVRSDVNLALAQRLAYAVDHASKDALASDGKRLREAANILRGWDGQMRTDSAGAAILTTVRATLWPALLVPKIAAHDGVDPERARAFAVLYTWNERVSALEVLMQHEPARWLPKGSANWNDFLATTMSSALHEAHAPGDLQHWRYGQIHTVEIAHPIFGMHHLLSRMVGVRSTSGVNPAPGDGSTVDAIGAHFGPSERFTADLSSEEAALGNITTGQSANPRSPWYLDQFRPWLEGRSFDLPGTHSAATHQLTLTP